MATRRRFCPNISKPLINCLIGAAGIALLALGAQTLQGQDSPAPLDRDAVLHHLNAVITWYRDSSSKIKSVGLPSDAIYQENARDLAAEAVRLAFQSAKAEATIITANSKATNAATTPPSDAQPTRQQNLSQTAAKIAAQIDDAQTKLENVNKQIATAPRSRHKDLIAQRDRLQGLLNLDKALQDTIQKMATFVGGTTEGAEGLEGSINELARSVPEVVGNDASKKPATTQANVKLNTTSSPSGLIGQSLTLFDQMQTMHAIDQMADETSKMRATVEALRKPLRDSVVATIQRGRDLANQTQTPAPGSTSQNTTQEFQAITTKFKELAAATMPLSQELVILDQSHSNFLEWRKSIVTDRSMNCEDC